MNEHATQPQTAHLLQLTLSIPQQAELLK